MKKRSFWFAVILILTFIVVGVGTLLALGRSFPTYYSQLAVPEGGERKLRSGECISLITNLRNEIMNRDPSWGQSVSDEQINSYLQEDFISSAGGDSNLPDGFHDPRVQFDGDLIRIGVRYGTGFWSTILTIECRVWLVANEVNRFALEIVGLYVGSIPYPSQILFEYITEIARTGNISVTWFRNNGNPVALLQYQADQIIPTIVIQRLEIRDRKLFIQGRSTEPNIQRTSFKPE
jgi:hypothetical protein